MKNRKDLTREEADKIRNEVEPDDMGFDGKEGVDAEDQSKIHHR